MHERISRLRTIIIIRRHNMHISEIAESFLQKKSLSSGNVGSFRTGTVDRNWRFYHVVQRTYNSRNLFTSSIGTFYHNSLEKQCVKNKVVLLCDVAMPTHTHELFFSEDVNWISEARRVAHRGISVVIRNDLKSKGYSVPKRVFDTNPGYVAIHDRIQLFNTLKYIWDNDQSLSKDNQRPAYSCFYQWEKENYKSQCVEIFEVIFDADIKTILKVFKGGSKAIRDFTERFTDEKFVEQDKIIFTRKLPL